MACLLALLVAGALQSCRRKDGLTPEKKTAVVKIGFDSFKPYSSVDENGNYVGIDIELATEAFRRMGYQAEFQMIPWERRHGFWQTEAWTVCGAAFTMNGRENDYEWAGPLSVQSSDGGRALGQPDLCPEGSGGKTRGSGRLPLKASGCFYMKSIPQSRSS